MVTYNLFIVLHLFSVITLIGPLVLTPKWLHLYHNDLGKKLLHDIHLLTGLSGLIVLLSGGILLWLQNGVMLSFLWMKVSIVIFIFLQIFDHFWADKQEQKLENNPEQSVSKLKVWLIIKVALYSIIALLMVLKP